MRKLVGITALFAGLALLFSAGAMSAYADPGNSGNTVVTYKMKIFKVECDTPPAGNTGNTGSSDTGSSDTRAANGSANSGSARGVLGFEAAPDGFGQIDLIIEQQPGLTAQVELAQQPASVAGSESAPASALGAEAALAAVASLPATSTGTAGLGVIGLVMTAIGIAMLKRQPRT